MTRLALVASPSAPARRRSLSSRRHAAAPFGRAAPAGRVPAGQGGEARVCIVGSSTRFLSGISYYTVHLAHALAERSTVSVVLMRQLVPRWLYPGRRRVGADLTDVVVDPTVPVFDGVDWFLVPSLLRATRFLCAQRPTAVVVQWWTAAVAVPYLWLTAVARRLGAAVIVELHEDQDTGEARLPMVARFGRLVLHRLTHKADALVVHSEWDRARLAEAFGLPPSRFHVVRHGPYGLPAAGRATGHRAPAGHAARQPAAADHAARQILFFGTVRPYKGLEDLVSAFELLPDDGPPWRLLVVGEPWEGWTEPFRRIEASPRRQAIEVVDRYVTDAEVHQAFQRADLVVLPYRRSSASGPLHLAMAAGLPVVVTAVGGLVEATKDYSGAVLVPPEDPAALAAGIVRAAELVGSEHVDRFTWRDVAARYDEVLAAAWGRPEARPEGAAATGPRSTPGGGPGCR